MPEEIDHRLSEIEAALAAFEERPVIYDTADRGRAGAFVSIDGSGALRVECGFVRPEDEAPVAPDRRSTMSKRAPRPCPPAWSLMPSCQANPERRAIPRKMGS